MNPKKNKRRKSFNFAKEDVISWIVKHNSDTSKGEFCGTTCILSKIPPGKLHLPNGWEYDFECDAITNKPTLPPKNDNYVSISVYKMD